MLRQHQRMTAPSKRRIVCLQNNVAAIFQPHRQMAEVFDYLYACREPDQVVGIGQRIRVIEIVHAPRETAFRVAPGAEAVNVKVATCENPRSVAQIGANLGPQLSPPVERTAEKHEQVAAHLLVLQPQIGLTIVAQLRIQLS